MSTVIKKESVTPAVVESKTENKVEETKVETTPKKLTKEEYKERFRNQPIDYQGRLYIDDKYKTPGKRLRIDNDDPATRKYLEQLGYTIVQRDVKVGSGSLSESSNIGSAVHIEQGIVHSQPGILYEIDEDLYQARKELEVEENNLIFEDKIKENQREDQQK